MERYIICTSDKGARKKKIDTYVQKKYFALSEGGGGYEDPTPPPLRHIISYANNPHPKSYIMQGQGRYY